MEPALATADTNPVLRIKSTGAGGLAGLVVRVDGDIVEATVRGDSAAVYQVGHDPVGGWHCDCPAYRTSCSHVKAVQPVVVLPNSRSAQSGQNVAAWSSPTEETGSQRCHPLRRHSGAEDRATAA